MGEMDARCIETTAKAFVRAGQYDAELFTALAKLAAPRLGDFNDQELVNTA